jgi:hypothetical protein
MSRPQSASLHRANDHSSASTGEGETPNEFLVQFRSGWTQRIRTVKGIQSASSALNEQNDEVPSKLQSVKAKQASSLEPLGSTLIDESSSQSVNEPSYCRSSLFEFVEACRRKQQGKGTTSGSTVTPRSGRLTSPRRHRADRGRDGERKGDEGTDASGFRSRPNTSVSALHRTKAVLGTKHTQRNRSGTGTGDTNRELDPALLRGVTVPSSAFPSMNELKEAVRKEIPAHELLANPTTMTDAIRPQVLSMIRRNLKAHAARFREHLQFSFAPNPITVSTLAMIDEEDKDHPQGSPSAFGRQGESALFMSTIDGDQSMRTTSRWMSTPFAALSDDVLTPGATSLRSPPALLESVFRSPVTHSLQPSPGGQVQGLGRGLEISSYPSVVKGKLSASDLWPPQLRQTIQQLREDGNRLFLEEKYPEAVAVYGEADLLEKVTVLRLNDVALNAMMAGDLSHALAASDAGLQALPNPLSHIVVGYLQWAAGCFEQSRQNLSQSCDMILKARESARSSSLSSAFDAALTFTDPELVLLQADISVVAELANTRARHRKMALLGRETADIAVVALARRRNTSQIDRFGLSKAKLPLGRDKPRARSTLPTSVELDQGMAGDVDPFINRELSEALDDFTRGEQIALTMERAQRRRKGIGPLTGKTSGTTTVGNPTGSGTGSGATAHLQEVNSLRKSLWNFIGGPSRKLKALPLVTLGGATESDHHLDTGLESNAEIRERKLVANGPIQIGGRLMEYSHVFRLVGGSD